VILVAAAFSRGALEARYLLIQVRSRY
jgi:hypothetical protein